MTLNISCPNCALNFPLVAGLNEADAKRYAALMGELPPALAKPLTQYLALFKPAKTGLTWSRALKLLGELLPDIRRGQVRRNGRDWPAPADYWSLAIQTMLEQRDKLTLPMRNHGYLYSILSGLADRTEAAQEQRVEAARAHRPLTGGMATIGQAIQSQIVGLEQMIASTPDGPAKESLERQAAALRRGGNE